MAADGEVAWVRLCKVEGRWGLCEGLPSICESVTVDAGATRTRLCKVVVYGDYAKSMQVRAKAWLRRAR
jgi:hypothetical protein